MFLAPLFLMGLIAIGVPLWLHRVARANPVQHTFPSLMLLEAAETQRTAKRTLRYWILLLLRILLIAALVLAFAGPLWTQQRNTAASSNTRLHAILLDASLSMASNAQWSSAVAAAHSVIDNLRPADQVMLVRAAGRRMDVVHEPANARDAGAVRAALQELKPGIERVDFGFAMSSADQWLHKPRPPVLLHLISDFQRSAAPLRFADLEPPAGAQLVMHDITGTSRANAYIEDAALSGEDSRAVQIRLRSAYEQPQQRTVILIVDGKEQARMTVTLAPATAANRERPVTGEGGNSREIRFDAGHSDADSSTELTQLTFENISFSAGAHRLEIRLEPQDAVPQDDRYFAVLEHANPKALLLARSSDADDAAYFSAAIGALTAPRVEVARQPASDFDTDNFNEFAVLVVPDVFALSTSAADRIEQYVKAGGALLTTLGAKNSEAQFELFESWQIGEPRARLATIGNVDASHPILRDAPEWHGVRFFRQRAVEIGSQDRVLIALADGSPLLVERTLGAGRMLVLTSPIHRAWNDLAIHPVFVQFISQATRYLIGDHSSTASVTVGTPVITGLTADSGGQIFDPSGARILDLAGTTTTERLIPRDLGFYEIRHANGARWLAVNTDRRESDLQPLDAGYLARWQALRQRPASEVTQPRAEIAADTQTRSLGPALLWLAALLLLAELLMANRYLAVRRETAQ
jgi:hypothetical protein